MFTQYTMMPDEYGCVVANRFGELLDDDADPYDLLIKADIEKDKKKDSQKKNKPKKSGQKESQKERRVAAITDVQDAQPLTVTGRTPQVYGGPMTNENRGSLAVAQRGTRRVVLREQRENRDDNSQDFIPKPSYEADLDSKNRAGFGSGRGGRGGGYSRNSEYFNLRGKREFERHSGTGISPEEKRGGRGPWNWGSVQDTMGDLMEVTSDSPVQSPEPPLLAEGEDQVSEADGEVVVQVAMEMTLDEWKALQEMSRPKVEFNLRQADTKVPTKARVIHQSKRIENHKESLEEIEEEAHFLRRSVNDITSRMDINFGSLGRPTRGGRGRGGRGGLVGCPEKDKVKCDKVDVLAPNPDDPEDFPALGAGQ